MDSALPLTMKANGGSPIVGEKLRHNFTGNERLAYERTRLSMLSQEYPNFIQETYLD